MANLNIENPNFSTAEREARQGKSTIYRQLLDMGFTHEEIEAQSKVEANTQEIFLNFNQSEHGGDPMIGIGYNPDHRYEEESGIGKIIETIHSDARNDRFMGKSTIKTDKGEFEVYAVLNNTDDNSYVVSKLTREMNDTLKRHLNPYSRYITTYSNVLKIRDMSVSELRAELKGKVVPLPKRLQDLQDAYAETILGVPVKHTTDAGNLSSGQFLTMMTANPILKAILNILFTDTVAQDQIATASSSNPFSSGIAFYDARDIPTAQFEQWANEHMEYTNQMEMASEVISQLKSKGSLYAISPRRFDTPPAGRTAGNSDNLYYFINYYGSAYKNGIYGWFTLDELGKIATGELEYSRK